jgi:hypothetical protein
MPLNLRTRARSDAEAFRAESMAPSRTLPIRLSWVWSPVAGILFAPALLLGLAVSGDKPHAFWLLCLPLILVELAIRPAINDNLQRLAGFRRAHAEAAHGDERVALLLRSFGQVHGYLDDASRFGALWFFDRALRNSGLRPVLLGTNMSVPPTHGVLLLQTADADWQAAFDRLARAAAVIIVIPETSPSLQSEMGLLRERGWLSKTVLFMMPEVVEAPGLDGASFGGQQGIRQQRWEETRAVLAGHGIQIPAYDKRGCLAELQENGAVGALHWLDLDSASMTSLPEWRGWNWFWSKPGPAHPTRQRHFDECWHPIAERRRFSGPPVSEVYRAMSPPVPVFGVRDVWRTPGADTVLSTGLIVFFGIGWGLPLLLLLLETLFR